MQAPSWQERFEMSRPLSPSAEEALLEQVEETTDHRSLLNTRQQKLPNFWHLGC